MVSMGEQPVDVAYERERGAPLAMVAMCDETVALYAADVYLYAAFQFGHEANAPVSHEQAEHDQAASRAGDLGLAMMKLEAFSPDRVENFAAQYANLGAGEVAVEAGERDVVRVARIDERMSSRYLVETLIERSHHCVRERATGWCALRQVAFVPRSVGRNRSVPTDCDTVTVNGIRVVRGEPCQFQADEGRVALTPEHLVGAGLEDRVEEVAKVELEEPLSVGMALRAV